MPTPLKGLRLGRLSGYLFDRLDADVERGVLRHHRSPAAARRHGRRRDAAARERHGGDLPASRLRRCRRISRAHARSRGRRTTRRRCGCAWRWRATCSPRTTSARCAARRSIAREVDRALDGVDALVLPSLAIPAPPIGAATMPVKGGPDAVRTLMLRCSQPFNLSGHPAISMPCGRTRDGLPIGLQLVGHKGRTPALVQAALAAEAAIASVIRDYFHRWEQELAAVSKNDRLVRPFEWGEDWIDELVDPSTSELRSPDPRDRVSAWVDARHARHRRVLHAGADALHLHQGARHRPRDRRRRRADVSERLHHAASGEQHGRRAATFPPNPIRKPKAGSPRRAVVVLAQWNSDRRGPHRALQDCCQKLGIASLRISLPYHDARMPPELTRADYIVSSNIVRTLQVCRQAVRDVRLALWWLRDQGYERLGLLGTSLGSCLSYSDDVSRAAGARAGAQSRLAVFRRRGVARPVDRTRAAGPRRPRRRRRAARSVAADQPVVVPRSPARQDRR